MSREYKLWDPLHHEGGPTIIVKHDKDCVFCNKCLDVFWDYTNLIYMIICEDDHNTTIRPCKYFEEVEQ